MSRLATFEEVRDFVYEYFDDWTCVTPGIINSLISLAGTAVEDGLEPDDHGPGPWDRTYASAAQAPEERKQTAEPEQPEGPATTNPKLESLYD